MNAINRKILSNGPRPSLLNILITMDFDGSTESDSYGSTESDSFGIVSDDSLEDEKKSIDEEADGEEKSSADVKVTKTCPKCNLEIKKIRYTVHVKNCGSQAKCQEVFNGKTCNAKMGSPYNYKVHCRRVEGKRHVAGTCQRLFTIDPFPKWSCPRDGCKYWTRIAELKKYHNESCGNDALVKCLVSTCNQKFKTTKLMKSHLGNISCHSAMERKGVTYTSKNRREITGRKKKKKWQKPSGKRKRVRLLSKKRYAELVLTSVEGGNRLDQSLRSVASDIFEGEGVVIKTSQLRKYLRQRDALNRRYPNANRCRVDSGAGRRPDAFLLLNLPDIKTSL